MAKLLACLTPLMVTTLFCLAFVAHSAKTCVHTVYVKTSDVKLAGTDAKVSLKVYDRQGNVAEIKDLQMYGVMGKGRDYFEQNNLDIFVIPTKCLPLNVCKIELSHDNTGELPAWNVDYLEVNTAAPGVSCTHTNFGIQDWLSVDPPHSLSIVRDACTSFQDSSVLQLPTSI